MSTIFWRISLQKQQSRPKRGIPIGILDFGHQLIQIEHFCATNRKVVLSAADEHRYLLNRTRAVFQPGNALVLMCFWMEILDHCATSPIR